MDRVDELRDRIDRCAVAAWTARTLALGGDIVRTDGLVTFLTGLPMAPLNPTLVERQPADPAAAVAGAEAAYRDRAVAFGIALDPARRSTTRAAVEGRGLRLLEHRPVMALAADELLPVGAPEGVRIVRGEPHLDRVARVDAAAFGGDVAVNRRFLGAAVGEPDARIYVAFVAGEAVACAEAFLGDGVLGVFGVATIPEARRRGIASAVTAFVVEDHAGRFDLATLDASELGHGVYRRLGFRDVGASEVWIRSPA